MSEKYFMILAVGKNVRNFNFKRSEKNVRKWTKKNVIVNADFDELFQWVNFLTFSIPETKNSEYLKKCSDISTYNPSEWV